MAAVVPSQLFEVVLIVDLCQGAPPRPNVSYVCPKTRNKYVYIYILESREGSEMGDMEGREAKGRERKGREGKGGEGKRGRYTWGASRRDEITGGRGGERYAGGKEWERRRMYVEKRCAREEKGRRKE